MIWASIARRRPPRPRVSGVTSPANSSRLPSFLLWKRVGGGAQVDLLRQRAAARRRTGWCRSGPTRRSRRSAGPSARRRRAARAAEVPRADVSAESSLWNVVLGDSGRSGAAIMSNSSPVARRSATQWTSSSRGFSRPLEYGHAFASPTTHTRSSNRSLISRGSRSRERDLRALGAAPALAATAPGRRSARRSSRGTDRAARGTARGRPRARRARASAPRSSSTYSSLGSARIR